MGAGLKLELRQSQQLVMTPQLQQAIKLLQYSNLELSAFIEQELERNPLLVREDAGAETFADPPPVETAAEGPEPIDRRVTAEGDATLAGETFDTGTENLYDTARADAPSAPNGPAGATPRQAPAGDDGTDFEARHSTPPTLREHLLAQIGQQRASAPVLSLARAIVEDLEEDGLFRTSIDEFCARLGAAERDFTAALKLVQRCDPTGVGARDLTECLALQLAERNRLDPAMKTMLDHLHLVGRGELGRLRTLCGVDREDIAEMLAELRALDPRPGAAFDHERAETMIPDVFLTRNRFGGWNVELNTDTLPNVLIDQTYMAELSKGGEATRLFLTTCRENANWLVRSLDQRDRTIVKVAAEIARQQDRFSHEGVSGLRPLSLKVVADAISMHESTVSRVTSNKYIATERGIFELKFFFSNAVGGGDGMSAESVRHRVKALVDAEAPDAVLSDDKLVDILRSEGIEIARRTVAKYRKALNIPSSSARRRRLAVSASR